MFASISQIPPAHLLIVTPDGRRQHRYWDFSYAALVLEPILVFMLVLPKHHPPKWLLAFGAMGLHCGIIATLRVPYANAFCLFGQVLVMRDEIMGFFGVGTAQAEPDTAPPRIDLAGKLALALVIMLTLAMIGDALPWWVEPGNLKPTSWPGRRHARSWAGRGGLAHRPERRDELEKRGRRWQPVLRAAMGAGDRAALPAVRLDRRRELYGPLCDP
jgi:hypothetical protein